LKEGRRKKFPPGNSSKIAGSTREVRVEVGGTHAVQNMRLILKSLLGYIKELGLYFEGI